VTLDPVLRAGGGESLSNQALIDHLKADWLPWLTCLTPNRAEARTLSGRDDTTEAGKSLIETGIQHVLITGADEANDEMVHNTLFNKDEQHQYEWPKLPNTYHGSGCTLACFNLRVSQDWRHLRCSTTSSSVYLGCAVSWRKSQ